MSGDDVKWDALKEAATKLNDTLNKISEDVVNAKKDMANLLNQINDIPVGKTNLGVDNEASGMEYKLLRLSTNDFDNFMDTIESDIKQPTPRTDENEKNNNGININTNGNDKDTNFEFVDESKPPTILGIPEPERTAKGSNDKESKDKDKDKDKDDDDQVSYLSSRNVTRFLVFVFVFVFLVNLCYFALTNNEKIKNDKHKKNTIHDTCIQIVKKRRRQGR